MATASKTISVRATLDAYVCSLTARLVTDFEDSVTADSQKLCRPIFSMVSPPVLRGASVRKIFIADLTGLPTCHFTEVLCVQLECRASAWETGNLFLIIFWNAQPPPVPTAEQRTVVC